MKKIELIQSLIHAKNAYLPAVTIPGAVAIQPGNFGWMYPVGSDLMIAIRGTEHEEEWIEDFEALLVLNPYGPGRVHAGILIAYTKIQDSIREVVKSGGFKDVILVGHSLGGALTHYAAMDILHYTAKVITFGSPRVGNEDFRKFYDTKYETVRVVNRWDIVPHLPLALNLFEHVGRAVEVNAGRKETLSEAHSLNISYTPGINDLPDEIIPSQMK